MVNNRVVVCILLLASPIATGFAKAEDPTKQDQPKPISLLKEILRDSEESESRFENLREFAESNHGERSGALAHVLATFEMMALSLANAGDDRFDEVKPIFEEIRTSRKGEIDGALASLGLVKWYAANGNYNSESDWERQIEVGKEFLRDEFNLLFDGKRNAYLDAVKMYDRKIVGDEFREELFAALEGTHKRLGKDTVELEELRDLKVEKSGPNLAYQAPDPDAPETEAPPVNGDATEAEKSTGSSRDFQPRDKHRKTKWTYVVVVIALLGILAVVLRSRRRNP